MKSLARIIVLLSVSACFGEWADIPLADIVEQSDLIVIGTLDHVEEYTKEKMDYGQGIITVHKVLFGKTETGEPLALLWNNACPRCFSGVGELELLLLGSQVVVQELLP